MKTFFFFLCALFSVAAPQTLRFYVTRQWKYINFTWPDEETLKTATSRGQYVPENIVISGVKYHDDHFYLTLPRMKSGVPATLCRIPAGHVGNTEPHLEPFPSWEMNGLEDCNNLQNVQNVEIDSKGQMWIIDGGRVQTLSNPVVKCTPKLVIYDLDGKRVVATYLFPEEVAAKNGSFLYDLVVDDTDGGYAYITDNSAHDPGIIVYSLKVNRSWKIRNNKTMSADPTATDFSVNDININTPINIAPIALGPKIHTSNDRYVVDEDREVYFCPLSSLNLYSINTTVLHDERLAVKEPTHYYGTSIKNLGLKSSQTVGMVMDNQGILYYNLLGNNAIGRWDSHTPFESGQRLISRDPKFLEWPNSFTFDQNGNLTVLTNRLNKFIFGNLDLNEYNFRLIASHVGGSSYLYDELHYDLHSSTSAEPAPKAEPKPEPTSQDHHTEYSNGHLSSTPADVIVTKGSTGTKFVVSMVIVGLGVFVVLA